MIKLTAPERGTDSWGSGDYLAPRGDHKHHGIDFAAWPGAICHAVSYGRVSKLGYPYSPESAKGILRYVEITTPLDYQVRYFYIRPIVQVGDIVNSNTAIGICQDLRGFYNDITPHIHFEVKKNGEYINPTDYLKEVSNVSE